MVEEISIENEVIKIIDTTYLASKMRARLIIEVLESHG